jgi:hypothetical protein
MNMKKAKPLVEEFIWVYLKENECVYPRDVADELGLEYDLGECLLFWRKKEEIC